MTRNERNALAIKQHECPTCHIIAGYRCVKTGTIGTRIGRCHQARLDLVSTDGRARQPSRDDRLSLLAEGVHTAWRKGTDAPQAMQIHRLISEMQPRDWGEYVKWLDWALGETGYRPAGKDTE